MDKKQFELLAKELEEELKALEEIKEMNSAKYSAMEDDELVNSLVEDYEAVSDDALKRGVKIKIVSENDKKD